jgi:hypothetical protein
MAEKRCLRQDLGIDERRCRLQRDGAELVETMQPARRMDVSQRHGENHAPHERSQEAERGRMGPVRPTTQHVIALVDRRQERFEVRFRPRFLRGRHKHQGHAGAKEAALQRLPQAEIADRDDRSFDLPSATRDQICERGNKAIVVFGR